MKISDETLEKLERAAHDIFCSELVANGYARSSETSETKKIHEYLVPYDELPEDVKRQNRDNVRDIPAKLTQLHYVMIPIDRNESIFSFSHEEVEQLAKVEHERWMKVKKAAGWTSGPQTSRATKQNQYIVPWDELSEGKRQGSCIGARHSRNFGPRRLYCC